MKGPARAGLPALGLLLPSLLSGWFPLHGQTMQVPDPGERFREANQLYQENRFPEALEAYQSILGSGFESADLHYNLGNAYFKTGDLGRAILSYERALRLRPGDPDVRANLDLARSLTADAIEPLPRFWVLSALDWWVNLLPRGGLFILVVLAWLLGASGLCLRILSRGPGRRSLGIWLMAGSGLGLVLFGTTLLARENVLAGADWGVILVEEVPVQSAPSQEDDLTLFHVHEGTKVRLDQRTGGWAEVVLEDGRVGWVPSEALETI